MSFKIIRRIGTRLGFLSSPMDGQVGQERSANYYDEIYMAPDPCEDLRGPYWHSYYYFLWAVMVDRLRRDGIRSIIEVGCGPGRLAEFLLEHSVEQYVGFDFSNVAVSMARERLPNARFELDDARTSKLYSEVQYDAIVCTEVLEHIDADLKVIMRFPAGKLCLCTVPSFPYESHVRYFESISDVSRRYSSFFDDFDIIAFRHPLSRSKETWFYLFQGVRNKYAPESKEVTIKE